MKYRAFTKIIILLVCIGIGCCAVGVLLKQFRRGGQIRNVLLISIDTCRADFLSCYGFPLETTPNIDAIAKEGVLFHQAVSPIPFTLPAHCSMHTGAIPPTHGVLDNGTYTLDNDNTTLAEILKEHGFNTSAFISSYILDSDFGHDQGFDAYNDNFKDSKKTIAILEPQGQETEERLGQETTRVAIEHLEEHRDEKQFMFVHYYDPHMSYNAPEPFSSKFASAEIFKNLPPQKSTDHTAYAGEIAYVDHCIGKIIDKLKELKLYDSTLICITADHGEMLGQHKEGTHGYFIYQGNIHVPLLFKIPGREKGVIIENTVGLIDVVPTICSALGIEIKHKIQGRNLMPYFKDKDLYPERYLFCMSLEPTKYNANPLLGLVKHRYKYIHTTNSELYDLGKDAFELNNLIKLQPDRARLMQGKLEQILEEAQAEEKSITGSGVDAETLAKLESLGYVGSLVDDTFVIDPAKEDPKSLIDYHVLRAQVGYCLHKKDYETAGTICLQMIEERPDQYIGFCQMAITLANQEKYSESIDWLLKVTELEQDNVLVYTGLADDYRHLKQYDTAIKHALKALEIASDSIGAYYQLSLCYYEKGMFDEPEKYLTTELVEHSRYLKLAVAIAEKLIEKGQIRRAYKKYLKILELEQDSLEGLNSVAWFQAASTIEGIRNPPQAVKFALKACEISKYAKAESIDTLAVAYAATGDFQKAISTAAKAIEVANYQDNDVLADRIQKRQDLYRQSKPYLDAGLKP